MSIAFTSNPLNQDRTLLIHPSPQPSDQRRIRTLLDLLTIEKMDGIDRSTRRDGDNISRWKIFKERLGLKVIGCCDVATWLYETGTRHQGEEEEEEGPTEGMNLAAALAAESSGSYGGDESNNGGTTPFRVSLMRL